MNEKKKIKHAILLPLIFLLGMWGNYMSFELMHAEMSVIGIKPQTLEGTVGILLSPFAHGSIKHIASNSVSFAVLSVGLFYFYRLLAYRVFFANWLISGFLLWIGGRESVHIGASGIVYGLAFFLFFSGVFRHEKRLAAISMVVVFLYGSMFWGMLPQGGNISWEGHLFGAVSGITLAWYYRKDAIDYLAEQEVSSISDSWGGIDFEYEYSEEENEDEPDRSSSMLNY